MGPDRTAASPPKASGVTSECPRHREYCGHKQSSHTSAAQTHGMGTQLRQHGTHKQRKAKQDEKCRQQGTMVTARNTSLTKDPAVRCLRAGGQHPWFAPQTTHWAPQAQRQSRQSPGVAGERDEVRLLDPKGQSGPREHRPPHMWTTKARGSLSDTNTATTRQPMRNRAVSVPSLLWSQVLDNQRSEVGVGRNVQL